MTHRRHRTSVGNLPLGTDERISSPTMRGLSENGALPAAREQGPSCSAAARTACFWATAQTSLQLLSFATLMPRLARES